MSVSELSKKLKIKSREKLLIMNSPEHFDAILQPLPADVIVKIEKDSDQYDRALCFVRNLDEMTEILPDVLGSTKNNGAIWLAYPKKSSKIKTDINRDTAWQRLNETGFRPVSLVAIDKTRSAMRVKRLEKEAKDNSGDAWVKASGKSADEWIGILKSVGCSTMTHKEIAQYIAENHSNVSAWWAQKITVHFERVVQKRE